MGDSDSDDEEGRAVRRGFDALRNRGLGRDGVESLRAYFAVQVEEHARAQGGQLFALQEGESELERRLRWEDAWILSQGDRGEFGEALRQGWVARWGRGWLGGWVGRLWLRQNGENSRFTPRPQAQFPRTL